MALVINKPHIKVKQFKTGCLAQYTYLIECGKEVAFVDPLRDIKTYTDLVSQEHLHVKWILETHYHADFVSGHFDLAKHTHGKIVFGPDSNPTFDCKVAKHNELLPLGDHHLRVLHTPGHTLESSCYVLEDPNNHPICVFTGDTLFLGEVGRPDLAQSGSINDKDLAKMLFKSLKLLKALPDDCIVFPAHGAGSACGKNISAGDYCVIGIQKQNNVPFRTEEEDKFVEIATSHIPAPPSYFSHDVALNKAGKIESVDEIVSHSCHPMTAEVFKNHAGQPKTFVLDCRTGPEFVAGHMPGAIFCPLDQSYAIWATYAVDPRKNEKCLLITPPGKEKEAITRLTRTGVDCVQGYLEGGFEAWTNAGYPVTKTKVVQYENAEEFKQKTEGGRILDVRNLGEWEDGVYKGATL